MKVVNSTDWDVFEIQLLENIGAVVAVQYDAILIHNDRILQIGHVLEFQNKLLSNCWKNPLMDKQGVHWHHFQFQPQVFSVYTEHVSLSYPETLAFLLGYNRFWSC
jgi:hypothetical protein